MIPTIDITKGAVLTMNALDPEQEQLDIEDEMAEEEDEDDFWLGKLGDFLTPCRPVFRAAEEGIKGEPKPKLTEEKPKTASKPPRRKAGSGKNVKDVNKKPVMKRSVAATVAPDEPKPKRKAAKAASAAVAEAVKTDEEEQLHETKKSPRKSAKLPVGGSGRGKTKHGRQCPLCGVEDKDLNTHLNVVHKVEGVVCPHCSKILAKRCTLSRHIEQVHFNLQIHKPATCKECNKEFSKKGHLDRHIKTIHMGQKDASNPCPHCGKVFSTKSSLEPHIMNVHQGMRKKCPECGKVLSDLWKHMRTMHGQYRRRAKISKEEAISKNLVPNVEGRVDVSDVETAKTVPTFTAEVDNPHSIEYVKVPEQVSKKERVKRSITPSNENKSAAGRRKTNSPVKVRMPFRNRRKKDSSSDSNTTFESDEDQ